MTGEVEQLDLGELINDGQMAIGAVTTPGMLYFTCAYSWVPGSGTGRVHNACKALHVKVPRLSMPVPAV
jgi:hypothetical protein